MSSIIYIISVQRNKNKKFSWQRYSLSFHRDAKRQKKRYHAKRGNEKVLRRSKRAAPI